MTSPYSGLCIWTGCDMKNESTLFLIMTLRFLLLPIHIFHLYIERKKQCHDSHLVRSQ